MTIVGTVKRLPWWVECCVCKVMTKAPGAEVWINTPAPDDVIVSHGYCPACTRKHMEEFETEEDQS